VVRKVWNKLFGSGPESAPSQNRAVTRLSNSLFESLGECDRALLSDAPDYQMSATTP
jgi:hypothetical protein